LFLQSGRDGPTKGETTMSKAIVTRAEAVAKGKVDGAEDVSACFDENGPSCLGSPEGWDAAAINAGVAAIQGIPEEHCEAYYEAYAAAAKAREEELVAELEVAS
jgi:hypothetical protein